MNPSPYISGKVDRRQFVQLALRSAALGTLATTGGYLALRSTPPPRCPRRRPCAECGWRTSCIWSETPGATKTIGG